MSRSEACRAKDAPTIFYSRRIGLHGGSAVPIGFGGRLAGRVGRYSIGAPNIGTERLSSPDVAATNFSVLRVRRDVLQRSSKRNGTIRQYFYEASVDYVTNNRNQLESRGLTASARPQVRVHLLQGVDQSRHVGLKISRPDDLHDVACAAAQASVHREETAARHPCQRDVLSVVRLHPAELLGDSPRFAAQPLRAAPRHRSPE